MIVNFHLVTIKKLNVINHRASHMNSSINYLTTPRTMSTQAKKTSTKAHDDFTTEKLSRKSRKLINVQLVKRASKEKILQPLLGRATMSAQYRNKVLNRVRSRKDDYYFFYYLFLRVMTLSRSSIRQRGASERDGLLSVERILRSWCSGKCSCLCLAQCGACSGRRTIEG